jgi:hypothetical protein
VWLKRQSDGARATRPRVKRFQKNANWPLLWLFGFVLQVNCLLSIASFMRTFIILAVFAALLSFRSYAKEIIPGVLMFDCPTNFGGFGSGEEPGDPPFPQRFGYREYLANDGRQININVRMVESYTKKGDGWLIRELDDKELKEKLADLIKSYSNVTNAPSVVETKIDGQKTISISYVSHVGYMTLHFENYWGRVQSNAVVEILLSTSADSEESLHSMRPYLSKIKFLKKYSPSAK